MKLLISTIISISALSLVACSDRNQAQYQPYQQQQMQPQVVIQQAPQDNSSAITALIGGAAIGAMASNAMNNRQPQTQVITREVVVTKPVQQTVHPTQQKPWFKPDTLSAKPTVAQTQVSKPIVPTPAPKPSFAPTSSYKQSAPRVTYSAPSSKRK